VPKDLPPEQLLLFDFRKTFNRTPCIRTEKLQLKANDVLTAVKYLMGAIKAMQIDFLIAAIVFCRRINTTEDLARTLTLMRVDLERETQLWEVRVNYSTTEARACMSSLHSWVPIFDLMRKKEFVVAAGDLLT
jgi:hypothetical protein